MANDADITLPSLEAEGRSERYADITLHSLTCIATAYSIHAACDIALPFLQCRSGFDSVADIILPALVVEAYVYSGLENAAIVLPSLEAEGLTGAVSILEFPNFTASGTSISGAIASANISLPGLTLSTVTTAPILASGSLVLPELALQSTSIHNVLASGDITLPGIWLSGLTSLSNEEIISYALNLRTLGLSKYEGYDFNSLCLINGKPFGASSTGLYFLEGDTDHGKMIDAWGTFPLTDFGGDNRKRVRSVYYGGNANGQMRLTVLDNEGNERRRLFRPKTTKGKTVVPIGRGGKGEYWQFKLENVRGANFEMNSFECFLIVLRRGGCVGC